jgi:hypothetical protein
VCDGSGTYLQRTDAGGKERYHRELGGFRVQECSGDVITPDIQLYFPQKGFDGGAIVLVSVDVMKNY